MLTKKNPTLRNQNKTSHDLYTEKMVFEKLNGLRKWSMFGLEWELNKWGAVIKLCIKWK